MMTIAEFVQANLEMLKRERAERFYGPVAFRLDKNGVPQALFFSRHNAERIADAAPPDSGWTITELWARRA